MADLAPRDVAIQASDKLQRLAGGLCADPAYIQFCSALQIILVSIIEWLRNLPDDGESAGKVDDLLEDLESLCQPHDLSVLADESSTTSPGGVPSYPALALLRGSGEHASHALQDLASDRKARARSRRRQILNGFKEYLAQASSDDKVDISPSNADLQVADPPECGREIASLHKTLLRFCLCDQGDATEGVMARIRLHGSVKDDDGVTFGVLFLAHPHQDGVDAGSQPWWQDTHIAVLRPVRFGGGRKCLECDEIDENRPFCSYISSQDESGTFVLHLSATGEKLFFQEAKDPMRQWELRSPSISLGRILETVSAKDLSGKMKEVLSWLLAKSVWQYYSSPWMLKPWTKESVHFLFERRLDQSHDVSGIFVNEPLLSVSITSGDSLAEANKTGAKKESFRFIRPQIPIHKIPKILALGVMLLEIQLGRPIESLYREPAWAAFCPQGKENINSNYNICNRLISDPKFFADMDIPDPLEDLIRNCIWPRDAFMPHLRGDDVLQDEERIREALYRPTSSIRGATGSTATGIRITAGAANINEAAAPRPTGSISTADWFARMSSLNYILQSTSVERYERVKIAILDTGVAPDDTAADYISGYRDFVDEDDTVKRDNTGHGTTSVNLVLDMCESADVYAVRIFETDTENDKTLDLAIKAIAWCVENEMDIVCMACGFLQDNEDLFRKIHKASAKMLIFAAPTNESNAGEIAYPARYDEVFCTFSTNGAVRSSALINPSRGLGVHNFAILGEDIRTCKGEAKSGTSFSTAILAGFAGRLLDFSRHSDIQTKIDGRARLGHKRGMAKVLRSIAEEEDPYFCIKPWNLLPEALRAQLPLDTLLTDEEKAKARHYICGLITTSLNR
ncbi:hypothetical protein GQ53DRAFT_775459 [Thozetella sp. PMI_491]|nr:hypothetical protein GQ53DRAFT_775459 [Thozetella sp. PMI_491]